MNIENYLKMNYGKNIDFNMFAELFFSQKYFYTLILPQTIPLKNEYLVQEFDKKMLGLIFTSKEKLNEYKKKEPIIKDWVIKEYETENFEDYFKDVNRPINGIIINYGSYWAKLFLN